MLCKNLCNFEHIYIRKYSCIDYFVYEDFRIGKYPQLLQYVKVVGLLPFLSMQLVHALYTENVPQPYEN